MLKIIFNKIPAHFKLLIKLYLLNLLLFFVIRTVFCFANFPIDINKVPFYEKLLAFKTGLEFDTAVFCWIAFLPATIFTINYFIKSLLKRIYAVGYYSFLILQLIFFFVAVANIPYFRQFGNHLNKNALLWQEHPKFILELVFGSIYYWGFIGVYIIIAFFIIKTSNKFYNTFKSQLITEQKLKFVFSFFTSILLMALITAGARGRVFDRSGLHEGIAIVSQNSFVNQIAINPNFTFWKTLLHNTSQYPYIVPKNINSQIAYTRNYLGIQTPFELTISRYVNDSAHKNYNVIIVVMESMSMFKMGYYNGKKLTPNLDAIIKESVFFSTFFSSGIHTFNGLFSTTSGFPSIYAQPSMKSYVKQAFNGLGALLNAMGYENYFYTTHDPHFDNMQGFFKLNKFDHFISEYDFDYSQSESSLGVPDHLLLDKLIEVTNNRKSKKPFLSVVMTASDHGPWHFPKNTSFIPTSNNQQDNCTLYADWAIGRFMKQAKMQTWYNNTIFVFLGDHGLSMGHTYEMPLSYNHVPLVIHQPKVFAPDTIVYPAYQPDIPATIMGILGGNYINTTFGINVLKEKHPFVVFSADDKIGCVDSAGFYYYETLNNHMRYLRKYRNLDSKNYLLTYKGKADSLANQMKMIYESANYFIQKDYFLFE